MEKLGMVLWLDLDEKTKAAFVSSTAWYRSLLEAKENVDHENWQGCQDGEWNVSG
jgi:hypothetical protein